MAGGKLSPRQRMINLMYLVFIAMLALNMGKEVLRAFGLMTEKLDQSNIEASARNQAFYDGLVTKSTENPDTYQPLVAKAQVVQSKGQELYDYIDGVIDDMNKSVKDPQDYEVKDKADFLDNLWFGGGQLKPEGKKFLALVDDYRTSVVATIKDSYPQIATAVDHKFNTDKVANRDGVKIDWLNYHYEGYPMVASETKLTQLQADIKATESEVLSAMLQGEMSSQLSMNNYETLMQTPKSAYFASDVFDGQIVLGRTDNSTKPNEVVLTLDGRKLSENDYEIKNGRVSMKTSAGNVGDHVIEGKLVFLQDGKTVEVPVSQKYTVIPMPNSATISADKMNVVYRGVENPMTIAFAGLNNVNATAPGLSKSGSAYVMKPTTGTKVTIRVSGTAPNGESKSDQKEFRIKDLPKPSGSFLNTIPDGGAFKLPKANISVGDVGAKFEDFDFDLPLKVSSFKVSVPGQASVNVSGDRMNAQAKAAIQKARRGDIIQIFDIKASSPGNPVKIKTVSPILLEVAN